MYSQNYPVVDNNMLYSTQHYQQPLQQQKIITPKEPLPSATDDKPNITLSTSEIAEFASTMVYLMWHARRQSVMELHSNSKSNYITQTNTSLEQTKVTADMANMTSIAFKKFCRQILSATQLSESVILLSLKYIAMLLQNNPHIQGADGSEYRLFTVALMLANKFLDDNTFTNKTWSEVSGMKVIDLNIMELEFLDVLRFRLSVRKAEYERWRTALFGFRHQLMNVPAEIQKQKLIETMALSVGNNTQWVQQQHHSQAQHHPQTQQHLKPTQTHTATVASVTHNFFLFSKSQQQYPVQPTFNGPLTRVQLRIPTQPVYNRTNASNYDHTTPTPTSQVYTNTTNNTNNPNTRRVPNESTSYTSYSNPTQTSLPRSIPVNNPPKLPSSLQHYPQTQTQTQPQTVPSYNTNNQSNYSRTVPYSTLQSNIPQLNPNLTTSSSRTSHRTSSLPQLDQKNSSYYYPQNSNYSNQNTYTTSYYVDSNNTTPMSTTQDYNPYNTNDYNRPIITKSTSYKNVQVPVTPNGHDPYQPKTNQYGPVLEDPLTAAESYRTRR